jgi:hypothetical protein
VVVGADLCPVTAQVCVTSMPGISEVPHRSMAVSSVAGLVLQVPQRACRLWSVPVAGEHRAVGGVGRDHGYGRPVLQ